MGVRVCIVCAVLLCLLLLCSCNLPYGSGSESTVEENAPVDVDYVFVEIDGTVKKMMSGDSFEHFQVISAQSTYLPNQSPYGNRENPSQYFEKENYFLSGATLEIEGTFIVSGQLTQDNSEQYNGIWVLQLDENSIRRLPKILECEFSSKIYLFEYEHNSNVENELTLSKVCLRFGQHDAVNTGE